MREGGMQRAVDLSSLERHAHTSCVLIIPRYALKKKLFSSANTSTGQRSFPASETSSRPMSLLSNGTGGHRSNSFVSSVLFVERDSDFSILANLLI